MGSMSKDSNGTRGVDEESTKVKNAKSQTQTYSLFRIPSSSSKSPSSPRPSGVKGQMDDRNQKTQTHVGTPEGKDGLKVPDVDIPSTLSPSATIRDLYYQSQKMQEEHYDTVRPSYQTQQEVVAKNNSHQRKYDDNSSIYDLSSHVMDDDDDKDDENDFIYRSTATFMHFKEATPSLYSLSDAGSVFSLRTIYNDSDDGKVVPPPSSALGNTERSRIEEMRAVSPIPSRSSNIIAKRALEPKIVVHHKEESRPLSTSSSNLLSRFSKSTAPARAKLFSAPRTSNISDEMNFFVTKFTPTNIHSCH
jgi:hypothetical protein